MNKMSRRSFLGTAGATLAGVTAARAGLFPMVSRLGGRRRPNFVIILCDDLGYGDLKCFGHQEIKSPHLDQLAADGMKLTECYDACPVCSPSRAGMLTGRTPYRVGVYNWIPSGSPMHVPSSEISVATLLHEAGYQTCHSGKWHCNGKFNSYAQPQPDDHGFDHWFSTQNNASPSHHNPSNFVRDREPVGPLRGYSSDLIIDEAIGWLDTIDVNRPFCLFVWFHATHEPVATGENYTDIYPDVIAPEQAVYFGNVTQMDYSVGRLMKKLEDMRVSDDTFVMFTSDNGPATNLKHSYGSAGPLRGRKRYMYEGGIRVPGIIRWPGKTAPGSVYNEPVHSCDVLPTLCEAAGVSVPTDRTLDGTSIMPVFDGDHVPRERPLYWQLDTARGDPKIAIREGDWKLLANGNLSSFELYNIKEDIAETNNQVSSQPDIFQSMKAKLIALHDEIEAEGPQW